MATKGGGSALYLARSFDPIEPELFRATRQREVQCVEVTSKGGYSPGREEVRSHVSKLGKTGRLGEHGEPDRKGIESKKGVQKQRSTAKEG